MACGDYMNLPRRAAADKALRDKAFIIAKNQKYDGYQRGCASFIYKFFDKKCSATRANKFAGSSVRSEIMPKQDLAEQLHKLIIRKFAKRKVYSLLKAILWCLSCGYTINK